MFGASLAVAVLAGLTGMASASLAISAYSVLLPVLLVRMPALDALFVCFALDAVNGACIFVQYRHKLEASSIRPVLTGAAVVMVVSSSVALAFGIDFISSHQSKLKSAVALADFAMGGGFLYRYYRCKAKERVQEPEPSDGLLEQAQAPVTTHLLLEEALLTSAARIDNDEDEDEDDDVLMLQGEVADRADAVVEDEMDAMSVVSMQEEISMVRGFLERRDALFDVKFKQVFSLVYLVVIAGLAGVIGFGGGNAFAIYYIVVHSMETVTATCASGLISGLMTLSLMVVYAGSDSVDVANVFKVIAIALPSDIAAVYVTSHYVAKNMSETAICALVAGLFFVIGTFALIFSTQL